MSRDFPPWVAADAFPVAPPEHPFGLMAGRKMIPCPQEELIRRCGRDEVPPIHLVWTPEHRRLIPPGEVPWLFDAVRALARRRLKTALRLGLFFCVVWVGLYVLTSRTSQAASDPDRGISTRVFLLMLVIMGALPVIEAAVGLWRMRSYTPEAAARDAIVARYTAWLATRRIWVTLALAVAVLLVSAAQFYAGIERSVASAGLVKQAVWHGQVWRLLTGPMLHGGVIHLLLNAGALLGLGRTVEVLGHWCHLANTMLASIIGGSLASLLLLPHSASVGISGGLLGLTGFLAVLGYRRRGQLPPGFLRSVIFSVVLIAAVGVLGYGFIDNAAHGGGLLVGVVCGLITVPRATGGASLPIPASGLARSLGAISALVLFSAAAYAGFLVALWR